MEKLKFTAYTDAKYRSKIGDDYTVLMDPDTLQFGKEIVYREDRQLGAIGGNTRFERYKPENLSFKITVDCTGIIEGTGDNDKVYRSWRSCCIYITVTDTVPLTSLSNMSNCCSKAR